MMKRIDGDNKDTCNKTHRWNNNKSIGEHKFELKYKTILYNSMVSDIVLYEPEIRGW